MHNFKTWPRSSLEIYGRVVDPFAADYPFSLPQKHQIQFENIAQAILFGLLELIKSNLGLMVSENINSNWR